MVRRLELIQAVVQRGCTAREIRHVALLLPSIECNNGRASPPCDAHRVNLQVLTTQVPASWIRGLGGRYRAYRRFVATASRVFRAVGDVANEARGNPLALLELPRSAGPVELAGALGLPQAAPVTWLSYRSHAIAVSAVCRD